MKESKAKVIYYHLDAPTSYDPLEADRAQNLPVARMLYLTPLEVSVNNDLVSTVLQKFWYDSKNLTVHFLVRDDLKFSDGSHITIEDVVLAITRMLHSKPKFPVIKNIVGADNWLKLDKPLHSYPSGIMIDGQEIRIKFARPILNPLFRFTLELFSIVPKKCIDLDTSKMLCKMPPASGYYELVKSDKKEFEFSKRLDPIAHDISIPQKLTLKYVASNELEEIESEQNAGAVLFGIEYLFINSGLSSKISKLKYRYLPYSYYFALVLNPNIPPFDQIDCRREFSKSFRQNFKNYGVDKFNLAFSLFTPILPGYLKDQALSKNVMVAECKIKFGENVRFYDPDDGSILSNVLKKTYENLNISQDKLKKPKSILEAEKDFIDGITPALIFGSGFWSLDPVGDLEMMFTPNLHPRLHFAATDEGVRKKLDQLDYLSDESDVKNEMTLLNQYIYDTSLVNVFLHTRKFYASTDLDQLRQLNQQISAPSPWQIFK